jgi:hypothetical protein
MTDAARAYDVFADLSGTGLDGDAVARHLWLLEVQCGFAHAAGSVAVLPDGAAAPATAWSRAVAHSARRRRHLVVILGPLLPDNGVVQPLLDELGRDPLFGSAQPRFAHSATDGVWPLPSAAGLEAGAAMTFRAALARLPRGVMTAEWSAALTVIRREVVSAMEPDMRFASVRGAVAHDLCQARRRGFRNTVANRVVVPSALSPGDLYPALPSEDLARLAALYPDTARAAAENGKLAQRRLEPLLSAAYPMPGAPRRLLLNCRGLSMLHNGTSNCVLGMLDGFAALGAPWQVDILADAAATEFHGMAARYPQFNLLSGDVPGGYAAAVMLNQPWAVETVAEMHRAAFLIGFNILDTIGWDILFPAPERLEWAWRFVARHSDLLMYISGFSQGRFRTRFPVAPGVTEQVVHLSLLMNEHALRRFQGMPPGGHVLLFGNSYDHKGIAPTLRLLAEAFPLQDFAVLGGQGPAVPGVHVIPSGEMAEDEVHRLVATARAVVYPSFYEGFGLPVVESLAYGRPVLVRSCPLWSEVAAHSRLPGRLIEFDDPASLIEALGRVLSGSPPPGLPFGAALAEAQAPTGWRDAAAAVLRSVEHRLAHGGTGHWQDRDEALRTANL